MLNSRWLKSRFQGEPARQTKTTGSNPRSTVGTVTEIYDYLRLLFAKSAVAE